MINRNINENLIIIDESTSDNFFIHEIGSECKTFEGVENVIDFIANGCLVPLSVSWEITSICNYSCPFCYIIHSSKKITCSDWYKYIGEMQSLGVLFITLTGGEPLLHPDFLSIYQALKENGFLVTIYTNASMLTDDHICLFKKYPPFAIEISLYGTSNEEYMKQTGVSDFERVDQNIDKLIAIECKPVLKSYINTLNVKYFENLKDYASSKGLDYYFSHYNANNTKDMLANAYAIQGNDLLKIYLEKHDQQLCYDMKPNRSVFSCMAGQQGFHLDANGMMSPCSEFRRYAKSCATGLSNAWSVISEYALKYKGARFQKCDNCAISGFCNTCIAYISESSSIDEPVINEALCKSNFNLHANLVDSLEKRTHGAAVEKGRH